MMSRRDSGRSRPALGLAALLLVSVVAVAILVPVMGQSLARALLVVVPVVAVSVVVARWERSRRGRV